MPKSLVEVAGEPLVAHQLRLLARQEITDIVICAGHLGEQIVEYVGDGARFGCSVQYSFDGARQLGTGGALRKAMPLLGERCFVMYGDSYLPTRFVPVLRAFGDAGLPALMTVFRNEAATTPAISNSRMAASSATTRSIARRPCSISTTACRS